MNYSNAALKLIDVFNNYNRYKFASKILGERNKVEFSFEKMKNNLLNMCKFYLKIAEQVELKLPKLNLPKLKKIE